MAHLYECTKNSLMIIYQKQTSIAKGAIAIEENFIIISVPLTNQIIHFLTCNIQEL